METTVLEENVDVVAEGAFLDTGRLEERVPDADFIVLEDTFVLNDEALGLEVLDADVTLELTDFFVEVEEIWEELLVKVAEDLEVAVLSTNISEYVIIVAVYLTVEQHMMR